MRLFCCCPGCLQSFLYNPGANTQSIRHNRDHWIETKTCRHEARVDHENILDVVEPTVPIANRCCWIVPNSAGSQLMISKKCDITTTSFGASSQPLLQR